MGLIYKIFHRNPNNREDIVTITSFLGITINLLIAAVKILFGILSSSIAIVSEGANNATDVLSAVMTLIGTKLAGKRPDQKHPFGYRRIEYITGIAVAVFILFTGVDFLFSSVRLIFNPEKLNVSYTAIIVIIVSAFVKFFLGIYTIKMGKKADSSALEAVGIEGRNDSFASGITVISGMIFLIFSISVDAYAGIIISFLIIKAGYYVLSETLSEIIGRPGKKELADKLYSVIRNADNIIEASDMILHNYGPDTWAGSVNVEIDYKKTAEEIFQILHTLQLKIKEEYSVFMVFGIYAVNNDRKDVKAIRNNIAEFVKKHEHIKSFHAVYIEPDTEKIYCDFVADYDLKDWDALKGEFTEYMKKRYPHSKVCLTIETEYV